MNICGYPASDFVDNLVRSYASVIHPEDRLLVQETVGKAVLAKQACRARVSPGVSDGRGPLGV